MAKKAAESKPLASYLEKEPTQLHKDFVEWVEEKVGYEVDLKSVQLAFALRMVFQKSDENQAKLAERREQLVSERERLEQVRTERAEKRAAREAAAAEKAAKASEPKEEPAPKKAPAKKRVAKKAAAPAAAAPKRRRKLVSATAEDDGEF